LIALLGQRKTIEKSLEDLIKIIHDFQRRLGPGIFNVGNQILTQRRVDGKRISWKNLAEDWINPVQLRGLMLQYQKKRHSYYVSRVKTV
jgi:hypothetical protein